MKRLQLNLDLTGVIITIAVGVLLPVMLATASGIVALVIAKDAGGIVTGVLVVSFAVTAMGSALLTVVLTGRKLRLARRQGDFLASMSHEFRTPLSAIRLYTQTLQSGGLSDDPAQTEECLATILRETEWLDVMIDRVLTWRASSRDGLPLEWVVSSVEGTVRDAVRRFEGMVRPESMALSVTVESQRAVRHDVRALNAVVLNILINAYKYTGEEKRIDVSVVDEGEDVVIAVRDNGVGFSAAQAQRIFQPFYRVTRKGGRNPGGAGLGLAIARYLVEQHGGQIAAESTGGTGSVFSVRLPASAGRA